MNFHVYLDETNEIVRIYPQTQPDPTPGVCIGVLHSENTLDMSTFKTWLTVRLTQLHITLESLEILNLT